MTEGGSRAVLASTRAELRESAERERASARRHALWALLGVSPGALVPLVGSAAEFGFAGLLAIGVAVFGIEGWRSIRASREAAKLERQLEQLDAEILSLPSD
jgi:hypothetical protein